MSDPDWSLYRAFLAVMTEGSLSAAARALGLTQPTLGRQVAQLERALGVALFTRSPQGLKPTDAALDLQPHAQAMAGAAGALVRAASGAGDTARGVVRLTASEIVGAEVLPAILADFRPLHPGVTVELSLDNQQQDLLRGAADIAVRMVRPTQDALVARRLADTHLGLYAHRRYLEAEGAPATLDALADHALIGFDKGTPFLRGLVQHVPLPPQGFAFRADSDLAQLAAVRAGFGIGFVQHGVARRDPDLVPVCPGQIGFDLPVWLVMHEDLRATLRMRAMFDHLAEGLSAFLATSQP
ncbi:LysR family transcriptional regulator [Caulobacter sp. UNC279MFTsu5.1]|uniref:LysR family transcriptional regulator n=1 Tax=Caulobacter sp. UNC279MFTsu5.1 TaxID=1502775 RepID=UPI0008DF9B4D|nr:LysR family transcriptional regulator [Caulobacter sp. UNC279MFTsu5.1]SFJ12489.1 transcriptional regulator, LysR family [Caulobacter sp. UNC279MFTsu5.1]